jgi:hypothetical protein
MTHLPLHRLTADRRCLQHIIIQTKRRLHNSTVVKEEKALYVLFFLIMPYFLIMSYMMNLVICISMILLDLLQYLICIVVIDLSSTFDNTVVWIYNSLFMFMIYF